jgi:hypothetical protein
MSSLMPAEPAESFPILVRPGAIHAFLEVAVRSLADGPSRNSPYRSARLTSAKIVRTSGDLFTEGYEPGKS